MADRALPGDDRDITNRAEEPADMSPADVFSFALQAAPLLAAVAILTILGAIVASISRATPGGMVPRTMDPAASWR